MERLVIFSTRCPKKGPRQMFIKFNKKAYNVNKDASILVNYLEIEDCLLYVEEDKKLEIDITNICTKADDDVEIAFYVRRNKNE